MLDLLCSCSFRWRARRRDPTEHTDLAAEQPALVAKLTNLLQTANESVFSPDRGPVQQAAACAQAKKNQNFWGPWLP